MGDTQERVGVGSRLKAVHWVFAADEWSLGGWTNLGELALNDRRVLADIQLGFDEELVRVLSELDAAIALFRRLAQVAVVCVCFDS